MTTLELQKALKAKGFDPGAINGMIIGNTIAAIGAFQAANGLDTDSIARAQYTGEAHRYRNTDRA